jgi:hypothetical protein
MPLHARRIGGLGVGLARDTGNPGVPDLNDYVRGVITAAS